MMLPFMVAWISATCPIFHLSTLICEGICCFHSFVMLPLSVSLDYSPHMAS